MNKHEIFNALDQRPSKIAIAYQNIELVIQSKFCNITPRGKSVGSVVSNAPGGGGTDAIAPPSMVIRTNQRRNKSAHCNSVMDSVKQQEMQDAIQPIADHLRDIGAGHHSDWLIKITNTKELAAVARDIEQCGYEQEADELYAIAAEY